MLKLRKILLCDYLYFSVFILSIVIMLIRLSIPINSKYTEKSNTFIGVIEEIKYKDNKLILKVKNKEKILATKYYKEKELKPKLNLGDKIIIKGTFNKPKKNTTKYLFNYYEYCKRNNIFYLVEIDNIKVITKNNNIYYSIKEKIINYIKNPYLKTFILGDKSNIDEKVKRTYQENSISHLFAISGMHICLLTTIISKLLKKIKLEETKIFKITLLLLIIYLSILNVSSSVIRSILFFLLFSINDIYYFYIKPINLFILIMSISLIINPYSLYDIGYLYSYIISLTLIISSKKLQNTNYIYSLFKVSIYSFLVSIPITIYNFYQINILGIIYNILFVPFISIIIYPLSLLVLIIPTLEPIYNIFIIILENTSIILNNITIGKLVFKRLPFIIYIFYLIIIFIYIFKSKKKYLYIFIILLLIHYSIPYFDNSNFVKMIDVGQGDSILLYSKGKSILVDTGGFESFGDSEKDGLIYFNTLQPLFRSLGIKKLNFLILTHGDKDHLGEARTLVESMKVDKIIINDNKMNYYEKSLPKEKVIVGKQGYYINLNNIKMIQLNEDLEDENDSSQIYYVDFNGIKILLTGDASKRSEEVLLNNYDIDEIDILKAGHHGSKTSTSKELLEEIKPKLVLISCGKDNKFKHPSIETIKLLKEYNIPYLRTDLLGTITIDLNNNKIITEGVDKY